MKRIGIIATALVLAAGHSVAGHHETNAEGDQSCAKHALVIQADFSGMVMAGVAYSVCPKLDIFNVRPMIPLYDIAMASETLAYNAQTWPAGTVFVSVVDPGVGTPRKSVVLQTQNDLYFVSPDNGTLSGAAQAYGIKAVREIDESVNRRENTGWAHTFHGRDVYSYTGARLAAGVIDFAGVGPLLPAEVILLDSAVGSYTDGEFSGIVSGGIDRLGNAYFNIDRQLFEQDSPVFGEAYRVVIRNADRVVFDDTMPYSRSFGSVAMGENLLFVNSSGFVSVAINQGNFAGKYAIEAGSDWTVTLSKAP
ncbi:MAG: SAM-dependent chlorinase/fluorinase [Pseudomonadota bacterium]